MRKSRKYRLLGMIAMWWLSCCLVVGCILEASSSHDAQPLADVPHDAQPLADVPHDAQPLADVPHDGELPLELIDVSAADTTEACDSEVWIATLYETQSRIHDNPPEAGPPPYDDECRPAPDKTCTTVCDCKFVRVAWGCFISAANKAVPWKHWPTLGQNPKTGQCDQPVECYMVLPLEERTLVCLEGKCRAEGPATDDDIEGILEFWNDVNENSNE